MTMTGSKFSPIKKKTRSHAKAGRSSGDKKIVSEKERRKLKKAAVEATVSIKTKLILDDAHVLGLGEETTTSKSKKEKEKSRTRNKLKATDKREF